jgi:hypothetical protein
MTRLGLTEHAPDPSPADRPTPPEPAAPADIESDPLAAFEPEATADAGPGTAALTEKAPPPATPTRRRWWTFLAALAGFVSGAALFGQAASATSWLLERDVPHGAGPGLVYVDSEPSGVEVRVDGARAGVTPMRLSVAGGDAVIELRHRGIVRTLPLPASPGQIIRQHVAFVNVPPDDVPVRLVPRRRSRPAAPVAMPAAAPPEMAPPAATVAVELAAPPLDVPPPIVSESLETDPDQ